MIINSSNEYGALPFTEKQGFIMLGFEAIGYFVLFIYF
jgi:hypothetical protein